jgi:CHAT domain-containing protein
VPLPDVGAEAETVAGYFHEARLLRGHLAGIILVEAGLRSAVAFHFAGHSVTNSQQTGLVLDDREPQSGRPRLLDADALRHLNSRSLQLAVLSACNTANAGGVDQSGFSSISQAFLRAGVPHVVASRWAVDSAQTRSWVGEFYRNVLSSTPVSEATRTVSLKMLANPQTAHPYYWSAFAAYGRP